MAAFPKMRLPVDIIRVLVVTGNMKCPQFQSESTCRFSPLINGGGPFLSMMPKSVSGFGDIMLQLLFWIILF
jgi:hypothetical protein